MGNLWAGKQVRQQSFAAAMWRDRFLPSCLLFLSVALLPACGGLRRESPTRTPVPTYTQTPVTNQPAAAPVAQSGQEAPAATATQVPPTPIPPTNTATATVTPAPTATSTPTPAPTPTPTQTNTPEPTPIPVYSFELETAEKFPTQSLAPNVVRVFAYVYSDQDYGLGGYSLQVHHNGARLPAEETTSAGIPAQTRPDPSAFTRFTNLNVIFVEAQAGSWTIGLLDPDGNVVGPQAQFELTEDESTRELYVRYRRK